MVTQAQIARKLGVSRQLVTFALSGYPQISQESRERILAAAREMGYSPNPYARVLRRGSSGLIGDWPSVKAKRNAKLKTEFIFIYYPLTEQQRLITRQPIQDYIRENG